MILWTIRRAAYPILDREWNEDREWKTNLVRRLRRGEAAPHGVSIHDAHPSHYKVDGSGWEFAERHAAFANRLHSAYLTDAQIAERVPRRAELKQAVLDAIAENAAKRKEAIARAEEERAARAEAWQEHQNRERERARQTVEFFRAWDFEGQRRKILAAKWACQPCGNNTPAVIRVEGDGYVFRCSKCVREKFAEHERVWKVVMNDPR